MFSQPSHSRETYTRYRDDEDVAPAAADIGSNSGQSPRVQGKSQSSSESQRLLQEVLGETLIRTQEDPNHLIQALKTFRLEQPDTICNEAMFAKIAHHVLKHRLGDRARKLPAELFDEIGLALWTNEESRQRVERLWQSLGAET